jgi:hypothetical protein
MVLSVARFAGGWVVALAWQHPDTMFSELVINELQKNENRTLRNGGYRPRQVIFALAPFRRSSAAPRPFITGVPGLLKRCI